MRRIITMVYPGRCARCGAELKPGVRALMIRNRHGATFYGVDCHGKGALTAKSPAAHRSV